LIEHRPHARSSADNPVAGSSITDQPKRPDRQKREHADRGEGEGPRQRRAIMAIPLNQQQTGSAVKHSTGSLEDAEPVADVAQLRGRAQLHAGPHIDRKETEQGNEAHEVYDFGKLVPVHGGILAIVGRSPAAARQLASRARRRIQGAPSAPLSDEAQRQRAVEAFLAASRDGDFAALLRGLDPDVVMSVDRGATPTEGPVVVRGAAAVVARSRVSRASVASCS
jgi:hypothetical protein